MARFEVQSTHGACADLPPDVSGEQVLAVALIGAAVGLLGGLFGKGGSAIATPLLSLVGIPPIAAVASPLPATIPSTLSASYAYWRERLIDWRVVGWSAAVGVPATVAGAYATRWIGGSVLVTVTEVIVLALGIKFLLRPGDPHEVAVEPAAYRTRLFLVAASVGVVSGLLANSGGFLLAPMFVVVLRLSRRRWRWRRCSRCREPSCMPRSVISTGLSSQCSRRPRSRCRMWAPDWRCEPRPCTSSAPTAPVSRSSAPRS